VVSSFTDEIEEEDLERCQQTLDSIVRGIRQGYARPQYQLSPSVAAETARPQGSSTKYLRVCLFYLRPISSETLCRTMANIFCTQTPIQTTCKTCAGFYVC